MRSRPLVLSAGAAMRRSGDRIYLSPPHLSGREQAAAAAALASNWVAPAGPEINAFEREFAAEVGAPHAVAVSSGTAALHLALLAAGVGAGDEVLVSTLTFAATAFAVRYVGAVPVFVDSDRATWNMSPTLCAEALEERARTGHLPRAVILVHVFGQCADTDAVSELCNRHGAVLIEDAAEALGARYKGRSPGVDGQTGIFSFNGNKIVTTSGGGMLVTRDERLAGYVRKLSTQAREPAAHYEHSEVGYNYRMSNILAAIGRAQLRTLEERVAARRRIYERYVSGLGGLPGIRFMPEETFGDPRSRATRWLSCVELPADGSTPDRETVRLKLEQENIESRPIWKPMHLQPVFAGFPRVGGGVAEELFNNGLCLPSGSAMTDDDLDRVVQVFCRLWDDH